MINGTNSKGKFPTLEQQSMHACQEEIAAVLTKYNCQLVYYQSFANGLPTGPGEFRIMKNREEEEKKVIGEA